MKLTGLFSWQSIRQKTKFWIILIIGIFGFVSVAFLPRVVGDVNGDGEVTDDDAWLVLQGVVGKINLSQEQQMAADVSGNGVVTAYDAELILQYVAGYIDHFPAEELKLPDVVEPPNVTLFIPEGLTAMPLAKGVEVPVMISDVTGLGIVALQFDVAYDTNVLTIAGVTLDGAITAGDWIVEFNPNLDSQGLVKVAMVANVDEEPKVLTGSGVIAKILFDVDSDSPNDCSGLNLGNVLFNEPHLIGFDITIGNGDICLEESEPLKLSVVGEDGEPTINACPSDDVVLYIEASNVPIPPAPEPLVRDLQFHLLYDETKLEVKSVELSDMTEERIGVDIGGHIVNLEPWAMETNIEDGVVMTPGILKVAMAQNPYVPPGYPDPPNDWFIDYLTGDGRVLKITIHVKEATESVDVALTYPPEYQVENNPMGIIIHPLYGDVSVDGEITADDATLILQHIVGLITLPPVQQEAADVTGDGTISAHDASFILRWVKGIINEFPVQQMESILNAAAPTISKMLSALLTQENSCSDLILSEVLVNEGDIIPEIVNGRICCPMDFSLTVEPSTITLPVGGSASLTVTIEWIGGFTGDVELSVEGLPNGVTARQEEETMVGISDKNDGYPKLSVSQGNQTLDVTIVLTADINAQPGTTENIRVKGTAIIGSDTVVRESPPITLTVVEQQEPIVFASGFYRPNGIVFDEDGNLYVANGATGEILRVSSSGGEAVIFATGFSVGAFSGGPTGLAFDEDGTLFVADNTTGSIWRVAQDGAATPFVGGLNAPRHIAIDRTNNIYVANGDGRILRITSAGTLEVFATLPSGTPFGLAFSRNGTLFVSSFETGRIFAINKNGTVNLFAELEPFAEGLCFDASGNLYVGNGYKHKIIKLYLNGEASIFLENENLIAGPVSLAVRENFLFAASNFRTDVYRIPLPSPIFGDVSGDDMVSPFDASLILQAVIGTIELSDEQRLKADVTGDNTVTALDAALILQYCVGLIAEFPREQLSIAPTLHPKSQDELLTEAIEQLESISLNREQRKVLEQLKRLVLQRMIPTHTTLLPNFPNPFNPETWLPYKLASASPVSISIYNAKGQLIRMLHLGNQNAGIYITKDKAAYWDGKDNLGEKVASGVYYYTLQVGEAICAKPSRASGPSIGAGEFRATRKMVILK